ncbi:DUF1836 domain-containing protein [Cerasibacillus terrae]|uniref:DUF1836 domain-containing protein n=1 Tax=Cerasibacillus terrae TaxID=2498845 RepID=A0A5C8NUU6_9BACI|nr:DUF1836 domain-containing protein [Cerasibacillus terrae]TXL64953.1 DUF1836 domain-containing protein [Cerasibacillus terrae]
MKDYDKIIEKCGIEQQLELKDIPEIDLYMDQVIQLFEKKFEKAKRYDDEKILTKTMINNYAKGKLFYPIKNKKYSKEHIILISLIYQLKGSLTIKDIKSILGPLNKWTSEEDFPLDDFYESYLSLANNNVTYVKNNIMELNKDVKNKVTSISEEDSHYLEKLLTIIAFVQMSNMYRKIAETLVDEIKEEKVQPDK